MTADLDKDWWGEDMEHNALIIVARDEHEAAEMFADWFGRGDLTTVPWPEMTSHREDGTVQTYWFHVYDEDANHVNDFMIRPWNDRAQEESR